MAAGACLLSPFIPLLFMGEEYGETAHFPYFISHSDEDLVRDAGGPQARVRHAGHRGRASRPLGPETFESAKLDRGLTRGGVHQTTYAFYAELLRMRGKLSAMGWQDRRRVSFAEPSRTIIIEYGSGEIGATLVLCFSSNNTEEVAFDGVAGKSLARFYRRRMGRPRASPFSRLRVHPHCSRPQRRVVGSRVQLTTYVPKGVPRATYRVQFRQGFGFSDAIKIVPYWAKLGISHLYASPLTVARPGSPTATMSLTLRDSTRSWGLTRTSITLPRLSQPTTWGCCLILCRTTCPPASTTTGGAMC